jgi:hypothetical protein
VGGSSSAADQQKRILHMLERMWHLYITALIFTARRNLRILCTIPFATSQEVLIGNLVRGSCTAHSQYPVTSSPNVCFQGSICLRLWLRNRSCCRTAIGDGRGSGVRWRWGVAAEGGRVVSVILVVAVGVGMAHQKRDEVTRLSNPT